MLALLAKPVYGLGRQEPSTKLESLVAAAQQAQADHDYAKAANEYKQAVGIEPNMPELWANLGLMQQQAGEIPAAIHSFEQANHLNPALYVPNLFLGIDFVRSNKVPQAILFLTKAEKLNKTDPQAPLALGRAYFAAGKFSPAAHEFAQAAMLDPKLGAAWYAQGVALLNQVEMDAHTMSIENKSSPFAGALYAESLEKQARFREAASVYQSLIPSLSQPPCMHSALGFSLLMHRDSEGAATEFAAERAAHQECSLALLGQARMAIDSGDNQQALNLLQQLWVRDHGFVVTNSAMLLDGVSSDAIVAFAAYLAQQSTTVPDDLRNALLAALNGSGQTLDVSRKTITTRESAAEPGTPSHKTAEQFYAAGEFTQCAYRLNPATVAGRADKLKLLAACAYFAGDNQLASSAATTLETLQPHSPEALYWSIQANERLALQSLTRFQQLESDSSRSHILLGDIFAKLERFDDAEAEYYKALALTPGDPAAMFGLASAYMSNNNVDKALEIASAAVKRSSQDPELNLVMADALIAKDRFAEAEPFLMKSLSVRPQLLGHVHSLIGKVYAEAGRNNDAIAQLKMAESSDEDGSIHYLLARLYHQVGDLKDASAALEEVKAIKEQRRKLGVKLVEDPDLSSLESPPGGSSTQ